MDVEQDPFEQVVRDTKEQIDRLAHFLSGNGPGDEGDAEVLEIIQDVEETITDLDKSVVVMQRSGQDTHKRESQVSNLKQTLQQLKDSRTAMRQLEIPLEESNHQENPFDNPLQEQMLKEQDTHLDSIHDTMKNLHLQAQTMGEELEDQGELLNDMDTNMDTLTNKLSRGRRQLEWIYEKNKERYNDCCIGLLIVVLIILLVLAFIA